MAARRWELDAHRRDTLADMDPIRFTGRVVRRVVVIDSEMTVREVSIYDFDSKRAAAAKLRTVLSITT